ncbi:hypothetical protein PTKIN_Ptkin13bG0177100 [Pterospermum kingtungense]
MPVTEHCCIDLCPISSHQQQVLHSDFLVPSFMVHLPSDRHKFVEEFIIGSKHFLNQMMTRSTEMAINSHHLGIMSARRVSSNSLVFLVTVLLLFMILNSPQISPDFLLWLVLGVFSMATTLRTYATCQQLQAQAQAHAAAASGLLGHTELWLHMPPSIQLATRGRQQGLRLQLAFLDREFDDLNYEAFRALDAYNVPTAASMSEEEINALPVHKYKLSALQSALRISSVCMTLTIIFMDHLIPIINAVVCLWG